MRAGTLVALCLFSGPAFAGVWSDLWRTPDQQGQALLAAGEPAQAAARFRDARLKGYAELQAGHYAQAAKLLAPFKDPTSEYDRGNALARSGHLQEALAAYQAALAQAPHDRDIRHNRDLVARALRRQPKPPPGAGSNARNKSTAIHRGAGQDQSSGARQEPSHGGGSGRTRRRGGASSAGAAGTGQEAGGDRTSSGAASGAQSAGARQPGGARNAQGGAAAPSASAATAGAVRAGRDAALAAAMARRGPRSAGAASAAASAAGQVRGAGSASGQRDSDTLAGGALTPPPVSEKTLALEQWLRQIPDDPAGLLRRKFMIDYLTRHPGAAQ